MIFRQLWMFKIHNTEARVIRTYTDCEIIKIMKKVIYQRDGSVAGKKNDGQADNRESVFSFHLRLTNK